MYKYFDVSDATSNRVGGIRSANRVGIVLHETIGRDSLAWLQRGSALAGVPASADFLISRQGDILQITRPGRYAFHTGRAKHGVFQDADGSLNQSFVGIEFENLPSAGDTITTQQYIAGAALIGQLCIRHKIPFFNIVGHGEVARPPGRKTDPITLSWWVLTRELFFPSREANTIPIPEVLP